MPRSVAAESTGGAGPSPPSGGSAGPSPGLGELLRNRSFLLLQARSTSAYVGYAVYLATVLWLSYRLTGEIALAGVLVGIESAVYTVTFLAAPVVDRLRDKRWVYVVCYPVQAFAALAMGITFVLGDLSVPLLVALVVLLAVLWDFTWAADQAASRLLFGADRLFAVSGVGSAVGGAVDVTMFFGAGATIALFGVAGGSYLYAGLLGVGAVFAIALPIVVPQAAAGRYLETFREGWSLYRGPEGRPLRHLALLQFSSGLFASAPVLLLTLTAARSFGASQGVYAALYVADLVGGIGVGLLFGWLNPRKAIGPIIVVSTAALGAVLLATQQVSFSLVLSVAVWLVVGVAAAARQSASSAYLQGRFAPDLLARVSSNAYLFPGIATTVGAFAIGVLSLSWSAEQLTELVAAGFFASAIAGLALPEIRALRF